MLILWKFSVQPHCKIHLSLSLFRYLSNIIFNVESCLEEVRQILSHNLNFLCFQLLRWVAGIVIRIFSTGLWKFIGLYLFCRGSVYTNIHQNCYPSSSCENTCNNWHWIWRVVYCKRQTQTNKHKQTNTSVKLGGGGGGGGLGIWGTVKVDSIVSMRKHC